MLGGAYRFRGWGLASATAYPFYIIHPIGG